MAGKEWTKKMTVACPPDKSLTHRALMFAGLAKGRSTITDPLLGEDCMSTLECFKALGVTSALVRPENSQPFLTIDSPGWSSLKSPEMPLNFGNSGTTARLLTGVFAATPGLFITAFGDKSLSARPMGRVVDPLRRIGAVINGRKDGHLLPFAILGAELRPGHHVVDKASAQVKSALLLAALRVKGVTSVELPAGSRDHTEKILIAAGAKIEITQSGSMERIAVTGPFEIKSKDYLVPGDPSSAAFLVALGLLTPGLKLTITNVLRNHTRTGFMKILKLMAATFSIEPESTNSRIMEVTDQLTVTGAGSLNSCDVEASLAPTYIDEVPILAVVAMFANGTTRFRGLEELRVKESDRLIATANLVLAAGGTAVIEGDDLLVTGPVRGIQGFTFDPDGDHRLAMAAGILATRTSEPVKIIGPDCVNVSFPGFFELIRSITL